MFQGVIISVRFAHLLSKNETRDSAFYLSGLLIGLLHQDDRIIVVAFLGAWRKMVHFAVWLHDLNVISTGLGSAISMATSAVFNIDAGMIQDAWQPHCWAATYTGLRVRGANSARKEIGSSRCSSFLICSHPLSLILMRMVRASILKALIVQVNPQIPGLTTVRASGLVWGGSVILFIGRIPRFLTRITVGCALIEAFI